MKVVVVAENVSKSMSGEALLAFQYVRHFEHRGIDVELVCHSRVRDELKTIWRDPSLRNVHFIEESPIQTWLWKTTQWLPHRVRDLLVNQLLHLITQLKARGVVCRVVAANDIDIVFEPAPIAPKGVSCLYDVGAPVVIGPMCGGLEFPPGFHFMDSTISRLTVKWARIGTYLLHRIFPGKLRAAVLLVANGCTQEALPVGYRGKVHRIVESGVDLGQWDKPIQAKSPDEPVKFVYTGRLVDWKGVHYLLEAFSKIASQTCCRLEVVGDGELMPQAISMVKRFQLHERVTLHGWVHRDRLPDLISSCDCMVVPSLRECGGIAMLEAMAMGLPLIGTAWAGPKNYIDSTCGILVDPSSPKKFVDGLAAAMLRIDSSPELRQQMGEAAQRRVRQNYFDWNSKTDRVIEIFRDTIDTSRQASPLHMTADASAMQARKIAPTSDLAFQRV